MNAVGSPLIEVVSGLTSPSRAEHLLLEALEREVRVSLYQRLTVDAFDDCRPEVPLLLIVPVLGDNDLRDMHFAALTTLSRHPSFASQEIVILLHGDRHVWDVPGNADPVSVKLRNAFYFSADLHFHPEKLDLDTASLVAPAILARLGSARAPHYADLGGIAMALGKAPSWDAKRKVLDFYDAATGFSSL